MYGRVPTSRGRLPPIHGSIVEPRRTIASEERFSSAGPTHDVIDLTAFGMPPGGILSPRSRARFKGYGTPPFSCGSVPTKFRFARLVRLLGLRRCGFYEQMGRGLENKRRTIAEREAGLQRGPANCFGRL